MAFLLENVGRREVDGNALGRQRQADGDERGAHALARFGDRLVGQANDGEGRQPGRGLHLDIDVKHLDALKRDGTYVRNHASPLSPSGDRWRSGHRPRR